MRLLSRTIRTASLGGSSLPTVWPSLGQAQIAFRSAEVSVIAGPPGAGKSTLALSYAVKAGVGTLYVSCDTHAHTMSLRLVAMVTGLPQGTVEPMMEKDREWAAQVLRSVDHIKWQWDSAPTLTDLEHMLLAYRERVGAYPELVVVDNAADVTVEGHDEFGGLRYLFRELKFWARETGAAFIVCHHTSEGVTGDPCPPRSALHGKTSQTPALVLTVGGGAPRMAVAPVKNRYGPADATGQTAIWLSYDPASMTVKDLEDRQ
jgi:RecA-family ATPase